MAADDIIGLLGSNDLNQFNQSVQASDPFGMAGRGLASWQPDMSTWGAGTSLGTSFGKSFLSGLLQNYARNNAADQLNSVVNVLPNLKSDPYHTALPEGVDSNAFNVLRGSAILKNVQEQSVLDKQKDARVGSLLQSIFPEMLRNGEISRDDVLKIATSDDPAKELQNLTPTSGTAPRLSSLLDAYGITDPVARAGIKTPQEAHDYLLNVANLDEKKDKVNTALESQLRGEWNRDNLYKLAGVVAPLVNSAQEVAKLQTPAGDLGLVDILAKAYNPGGVIRPQFMSMIKEAQNPLNKYAGDIEKVMGGGQFNATTRQQMIDAIKARVNDQLLSAKMVADAKLSIAKNKGLVSDNIIPSGEYDTLFGGLGSTSTDTPKPTGEMTKSGKKIYIVNGVKGTID